ncbi:MAG: DUF2336 domain-containing protein, partial [Rhodospirillales bacterium]|nr:DUF2336 domain-containing protein [Rhodospirillales bacterium]
DVDRLLAAPLPPARIELAGKLAEDLTQAQLSEAELKLAQDIVRILARDVEVTVRAALASNLQTCPLLPRDVAQRLARDVEAVALPILARSLVLTDEDLVEIVGSGSSAKQSAVAGRPTVSEAVAEALITIADERAVATLMRNDGAAINERSLNRAVDRFAASDAVMSGMVERSTLPVAVAERLATIVSDELRQHLVEFHALPAQVASDIVLRARERAILQLGRGVTEPDLRRLLLQMHRNGRLTPSLILRAICTGDIAFFEAALAELAGVPPANAQMLIHDGGRQGLPALYSRAGLPPGLFPVFRAAVDTVQSTTFDGEPRDLERYRARVIARVLSQLETLDSADLDYLVGKLDDMLRVAA